MAGNKKTEFDFNSVLNDLRNNGPKRVYLLYGEEDYLLGLFYSELKKNVLPDGADDFCYKKIADQDPDISEIISAVDAMPFMADHTFVELNGLDINKYKKAEELQKLLSDIPEYCTVAIIPGVGYSPDMRLKINKMLKDSGNAICFSIQSNQKLVKWIQKRFKAENKNISDSLAERLIFVSGDSMSGLIPEISKIASYASDKDIKLEDINTAAHHLPEADVYEMIDDLFRGNVDSASQKLSEVLYSKETGEPIYLISMIGMQLKRLLAAKLASAAGYGSSFLVSAGVAKYDKLALGLMKSIKKIRGERLAALVDKCSEYDYKMKSSVYDNEELLKELFTIIAKEVA